MPSRSLLALLIISGGLIVAASIVTLGSGSLTSYLRTQVTPEEEAPTPTPTDSDTPAASQAPAGYCGNGIVEPPEECDAAGEYGLTCSYHCKIIVPPEGCGDGLVEYPEECDEADLNGTAACTADCKIPEPLCGNGFINSGETCDVGTGLNGKEGYPCTADCQLKCGNGIIETPETCDSGSSNGAEGSDCSADCRLIPKCGNGIKEASEACDKGVLNGQEGSDCSDDCTIPEPPAPSAAPQCEKIELACLCQYQEVTQCAGLTAAGEQTCETTNTPPHGDRPECEWVSGQCISRHKQDCQEWLEKPEQNACTHTFGPTPDDVDPATIPGFIKPCQDRRVERIGHGEGCYSLTRRVRSCLKHVRNLEVRDLGCSTFEDQVEAEAYMAQLQAELLEGQTFTVTANQGSGGSVCNTFMSYQGTITSLTKTYDQCHPPDSFCYSENKINMCTDGTILPAEVRLEVCCPNGWQEGGTCTTTGTCRGRGGPIKSLVPPLACNNAHIDALDQTIACLAGAKTACEERNGTFTDPDSIGSDLECNIRESRDWPFCWAYADCPWKCEGGAPLTP